MGGCRCYFRECHVTSQQFPGMHFFRFPQKEAERYKKWRQYAKMDKMLEFSEVRRGNTSICGRHFRPECFMNYKLNRLTRSAVPTLMRLSNDKALDYELDIESGVLVDLEQPKLKHLLPPDNFECPLFMLNDKMLLEKLNELETQQYNSNDDMELINLSQEECEKYLENPPKTVANPVEILETIHVAAPSLKRPRQKLTEEKVVNGKRNKKCRILNASNCAGGNDVKKVPTVFLASIEESEEINFVETIEIEKITNELESDDGQLFSTSDSFINDDYDEDLEINQVHRNEDDFHNSELPINDADATVVELKSQIHTYGSEPKNVEIINVQKQLLEYNKIKQDFDELYIKYSMLETENNELKKNCQQNEEISRNQLLLQVEVNNLRKSLKDFNLLREQLKKYSEENQKLKNETTNTEALKAELISRKVETNELKKLLEALRDDDSKRQYIELEIKSKEISGLQKKLELSQQQLSEAVGELKMVQANLNSVENEKERLIKNENKLKESLRNIANNFDLKQNDYNALKSNFEDLQAKHSALEQKYWKLQALQNQESSVSTSLDRGNNQSKPAVAPAAASLTKAQLFNGIKRYLCSSMVSLLRMEMFGTTEREWKTDERQVAVDILRLGEVIYKYFTDELRIRLPALRDARDWLNRTQQLMEDEEDL